MGFGGGAHAGISISSFPKATGVTESFYGLGFGFGAHGDLSVVKFFTARLSVDYNTFPSDKDKIKSLILQANPGVNPADVTFEGINVSIISFTLNGLGKIPTGSSVTPYGILGFGLHLMSASDPKVTYQGQDVTAQAGFGKVESETKFGLNFGAGAELALGGFKLFVEAKYVLIFAKDDTWGHIPIIVGVTVP
jgi:opacity protein-like surface antigen